MKFKFQSYMMIILVIGLVIGGIFPLSGVLAEEGGPTVTVNQQASQEDPTNEATIAFDVAFSEDVQYFTDKSADVDISGTAPGAKVDSIAGGPQNYVVTVSGMTASGTVIIDIPAGAARGITSGLLNEPSTSTDNEVTYDIVPPTFSYVRKTGDQDDPTNTAPILFEVKFNEPVVGFEDASDVDLTSSTAPGATATIAADGPEGTDYLISVSGMTGSGLVKVAIPAEAATDLAGNPSPALAVNVNRTVEFDVDSPEASISTTADPTNANPLVTIHFEEEIVGELILSEILVDGPFSALDLTEALGEYTLEITPDDDGLFTVQVKADAVEDVAGNGNLLSDVFTVEYDSTNPIPIITSSAGADGDTTSVAPIPFTIDFGEDVTGFIPNEISVVNGDVTSFTGGPAIYAIEVTPDDLGSQATITMDIGSGIAKDLAGNLNDAAETFELDYDPDALTVSIAPAGNDPTNAETIHFTATFSELIDTKTFIAEDVLLGGTANADTKVVAEVGESSDTFNIAVSGMTQSGTVQVSIPADAVENEDGGKFNIASSIAEVTYDNISPAVTLSSDLVTEPTTSLSTFPLTITFSEEIVGFGLSSITYENATVSNLFPIGEGGDKFGVDVSPIDEGDVIISIDAGVVTDLAGNDNLAATPFEVEYQSGFPTVVSIIRLDPNPTNAAEVRFLVTFSEIVEGVGAADFELTTSDTLTGVRIVSISGIGPDRIVTVDTGTGSGTLRLDVAEDAEIEDEDENLIIDLPYIAGQVYQISLSSFADVSPTYWAWEEIEILYSAGVTDGCSSTPTLRFCPNANVTRAEMAKFLLTAINGVGYEPTIDATRTFTDVSSEYWAYKWIENLYEDGLTDGCSQAPRRYCPDGLVTRAEMAKFLLSAMNADNPLYQPPKVTFSSFGDILNDYWAKNWIEELYNQGVTTGCTQSPLNYCPEGYVTRAEMAVFLVRAFDLGD